MIFNNIQVSIYIHIYILSSPTPFPEAPFAGVLILCHPNLLRIHDIPFEFET